MTKSKIEFNKTLTQTITALIIVSWLLIAGEAGAQQAPEFLVTWRALNYVPADYLGKILPSQSSRVEAGFDLISQNRIADLSRHNILWFVNDELIASGVGIKTAPFQVNTNLNQTVRITIADYQENDLIHTFIIPVTDPEVVIDTKTPTQIIRGQARLPIGAHTFSALPFFFNVENTNELKFNWRINNNSLETSPISPDIFDFGLESADIPQEIEFSMSVGIRNLFNLLELGSKTVNFLIK